MAGSKYVYTFEEGDAGDKMLLGGKGANLCAMTQIGLDVPPGFVISTAACLAYLDRSALPDDLMAEVRAHVGDARAQDRQALRRRRESAPGLGALRLGDVDARDDGHDPQPRPQRCDARGADPRHRQSALRLRRVAALRPAVRQDRARRPRRRVRRGDGRGEARARRQERRRPRRRCACETRRAFSRDLHASGPAGLSPPTRYEQLRLAIEAVFRSWNGKRAVDYRRQFRITKDMANGTAVNVVAMVFGNLGDDSATGVGFTRNPGTGENAIYGEYLVNAQGEDVVAGIRTPKPIAAMAAEMPALHRQLVDAPRQARSALPGSAGLRVHDREGPPLLPADAQRQDERAGDGRDLRRDVRAGADQPRACAVAHQSDAAGAAARADARPAARRRRRSRRVSRHRRAPHRARSCSTPTPPSSAASTGEKVVLVREETKPEDIHGFFAAQAILTSRGGKTSHAAVVARGMGKPCVSGCEAIRIDVRERRAEIGGTVLREGDVITVDGTTGNVYAGAIPTVEAEFFPELATLLGWADAVARSRGARECRHAARRGARPAVRCEGDRALPHRADVQRQRAACRSSRR